MAAQKKVYKLLRQGGPHTAYVGITQSGKSALARWHAWQAVQQGRLVLVFNPMKEKWCCRYQTDDPAKFCAAVDSCRGALCFIDEAATDFYGMGKDNERKWLLTRGRHKNHRVHLMWQHYTAMPLGMREQCTQLWVAQQGPKVAQTLAEQRNDAALRGACEITRGKYYHKESNNHASQLLDVDLVALCKHYPAAHPFVLG